MSIAAGPLGIASERAARYRTLAVDVAAVLDGETDRIARMATVVAMLVQAFADRFLWTGFYIVDVNRTAELVVGPYQGTLGCLRIAYGRGVCGQAAQQQRTLIVADVHAFPDHIACDARAMSEIVLPVFDPKGALIAVLDIDAAICGAFDAVDAHGLETLLKATFAVEAAYAGRSSGAIRYQSGVQIARLNLVIQIMI